MKKIFYMFLLFTGVYSAGTSLGWATCLCDVGPLFNGVRVVTCHKDNTEYSFFRQENGEIYCGYETCGNPLQVEEIVIPQNNVSISQPANLPDECVASANVNLPETEVTPPPPPSEPQLPPMPPSMPMPVDANDTVSGMQDMYDMGMSGDEMAPNAAYQHYYELCYARELNNCLNITDKQKRMECQSRIAFICQQEALRRP